MKKIDKVILIMFSVLIFIESFLIICLIFGWTNILIISKFITMALNNETASRVILGITIIYLLCSIKCIFFDSSEKKIRTKGILMQNDNGKLLISKATIENLVLTVVKGFSSAEEPTVSVDFNELNDVKVNVNISVAKEVIIKELTLNMQNKIKETIKKTSDLEVKEINISIRNIAEVKEEKNKE